ncbi:two-component system aerobic respiration control sensor histidine kinase ArcB [Cricetibacter osteomyelitidis]|uniref:Aerobic respiration control sensor protein n=1 Tax=Cricetibacter osteomyelitidis TaxID=1521931 RepID=A0A4R2SXW1_9PAST|nr:ATP-binding protein [Cricetibacter osteomyelitidis]TCP93304.1 two-component system aerobic respiration control sensor histidine kinase ArcB [Cricetibacter osteomyelitidis]
MQNIRKFAQRYVDWVIKLGRFKFTLLGFAVLAVFALGVQLILSYFFIDETYWQDLIRSIIFGLISAPFFIYFFNLLVEKLERSRQQLARYNQELNNKVYQLNQAKNQIEQASRNKTELMATISHELRTPLNGIVGLSRILLDGNLTEEQRNYLQTINVSAVSLGHIFNDIIDLEKLDSRRIDIIAKDTDFTAWLNDINNFATIMTAQKKLKFIIQYGDNLPHWANFDGVRLSQILWNLISNAVKFTEKGEIILKIDRTSEDQLQFSLTDSGIGIPQEELGKIFAMYYQVQANKRAGTTGSGIGLSISKRIAKLMGGDLSVESQVGIGSTFRLQIKINEASPPSAYAISNVHLSLHILLVEDLEINVIVAKSLLEKLGYQVDVANNGEQALQKFEQNQYDLILLDILLPDMSGFDIARRLRQNYEDGIYDYLPPLVALTANVLNSKTEYQQKGMDDVLAKPLSVEALNACLLEFFADEINMNTNTSPENPKSAVQNSEIFDVPMLLELKEMLGLTFLQDNLALFKQTMPNYIQDLNQSYKRYLASEETAKTVAQHAHKIKGAAAAVGLKHLQQIAQQAQTETDPQWQTQIARWIDVLTKEWLTDVEALENWLKIS